MKRHTPLLLFCTLMMLMSACSSNEETQEKNVTPVTEFILTEPDYNTEAELTRTTAEPTTQQLDLGNGIEATAVIERDNEKDTAPATRAELSNQHYMIYAVKNGVRVPGFTLRGTVSGSGANKKFTPDNGTTSIQHLEEGTYTFVCYNDNVFLQSNRLVVTHQNAEKALIGVTSNVHVTGKKQQVTFEMKHQAARVRFEIVTYWAVKDIKLRGTIYSPSQIYYDIDGANLQYPLKANRQHNLSFANQTTAAANFTYTSQTEYAYVLPGAEGNITTMRFTAGSLYEKNIASAPAKLVNTFPTNILKANESYKVKLTLYYKFNYLFSDGTTGTLVWGHANNKTPIATVVTAANSTPLSGMTMALNAANNNGSAAWATDQRAPYNQTENYGFAGVYNDMNGEGNTYNVVNNATATNLIKANSDMTPAFKAAANYYPGVATQNTIGRWYLPAMGEMKTALVAMAGMNAGSLTEFGTAALPRFALYAVILRQAGGMYHAGQWTSNEIGGMGAAVDTASGKAYFGGNHKNINYYYRARPFVHFTKRN